MLVDAWQAALLVERLRARQFTVEEYPFTSQSVDRLGQALYARLRGHGLRLPADDPELIDELANVQLRETSPGVFRLDHRPGRHDDRAVALGMACFWLGDQANTWRPRPIMPGGVVRESPLAAIRG